MQAIEELIAKAKLWDDFPNIKTLVEDFPNVQQTLVDLPEDLLKKLDAEINTGNLRNKFAENPERIKGRRDLARISKKVNGVPQGHALRFNTDFIDDYLTLTPAKQEKMASFLDKQKNFVGKKGEVNYTAQREIDIGDGVVRTYIVQ
ncbi:MAG: hypothetical protein HRU41_41250, partial [Saprospiraceae bacterium]|nr:hypothetical protein [Saprospiraceae bacterium]